MPLPDVPFDERRFVLPNERGRVLTRDNEPLAGVYVVGWIKRGPTGILGTNKRDAEETVGCLVEDLRTGALPAPSSPGWERIDALLAKRRPDLVKAFCDVGVQHPPVAVGAEELGLSGRVLDPPLGPEPPRRPAGSRPRRSR